MPETNLAVPGIAQIRALALRRVPERRRERRVQCDAIDARVRVDDNPQSLNAQVLDISTSGVRLGLDISLTVGSDATLYFNDTIATGQVRYCRRTRDGFFDAGLQLSDVLNFV